MTTRSDAPDQTAGRELVATRLINAPRELVFHAFREPERLARWWGPNGFRNTVHEFDFRPGGHWRLTLHGSDGTDYKNDYVLLEVAEAERIVISHPDPAHSFQLTVTLAARCEKTLLTWRMCFETAEHCQQVKPFVVKANEQNLDRLEAELARIF